VHVGFSLYGGLGRDLSRCAALSASPKVLGPGVFVLVYAVVGEVEDHSTGVANDTEVGDITAWLDRRNVAEVIDLPGDDGVAFDTGRINLLIFDRSYQKLKAGLSWYDGEGSVQHLEYRSTLQPDPLPIVGLCEDDAIVTFILLINPPDEAQVEVVVGFGRDKHEISFRV